MPSFQWDFIRSDELVPALVRFFQVNVPDVVISVIASRSGAQDVDNLGDVVRDIAERLVAARLPEVRDKQLHDIVKQAIEAEDASGAESQESSSGGPQELKRARTLCSSASDDRPAKTRRLGRA